MKDKFLLYKEEISYLNVFLIATGGFCVFMNYLDSGSFLIEHLLWLLYIPFAMYSSIFLVIVVYLGSVNLIEYVCSIDNSLEARANKKGYKLVKEEENEE